MPLGVSQKGVAGVGTRPDFQPSNTELGHHPRREPVDAVRLGEGDAGARNEVFRPDQSLRSRYREDFWWKLRLFIPHDWPPGDLPVSFITVMQIIGGTTQLGWDPDFKLRIDCDNTWH
jgi:hypothetical protein